MTDYRSQDAVGRRIALIKMIAAIQMAIRASRDRGALTNEGTSFMTSIVRFPRGAIIERRQTERYNATFFGSCLGLKDTPMV